MAITSDEFTTYTGMVQVHPSIFPSYSLSKDDPLLRVAHTALVDALGRDVGIDTYRFATDGGHLMAAGIPTIGFGPGDDLLAHTNQERISLTQMQESLTGYIALILALSENTGS